MGIDLRNKSVPISSKISCNFTSKCLTIRRLYHLHCRGKRALEEGRHDETGKNYCNGGADAGNGPGSTRYDNCGYGTSNHCRQAGWYLALFLGVLRLPSDLNNYGAYLWEIGRSVRT